jgi:DNA-binding NarL/FixJ family response regulator
MPTVLVVDDHPVFRRGIATLFEASGWNVVGEAGSAVEAVELARRLGPEVILMDLGLPDGSGIDAIERIVGESPSVRVVVVTMYDDDGAVRRALAAGANGYIVKDADHAEILAVVEAARVGGTALGSGVARTFTPASPPAFAQPAPFGFTPRERDIADLVRRGLTNRQIADRLGLSGKTVSNNVSVILAKSGAADRVELATILREARV